MDLSTFDGVIRSIAQDEIGKSSISNNYYGTVVSVASNYKTAVIKLVNDSANITFINKCQDKLQAGDTVIVEAINGNLSNAVVSRRLGENTTWSGTFLTGGSPQKTVTVINGIIVSVV